MRWLDCLSSLEPEDLGRLKEVLESDFGRTFSDLDVRDAARRLCSVVDLMLLTDNQPEGGRGELIHGSERIEQARAPIEIVALVNAVCDELVDDAVAVIRAA